MVPKDLKNTVMSLTEEKKNAKSNLWKYSLLKYFGRGSEKPSKWTILPVNPTHTFQLKVQEVIITMQLQLQAWF